MPPSILLQKQASLSRLIAVGNNRSFDDTLKSCLSRAASMGIAPMMPVHLRPIGLANRAVERLESVKVVGRVG